MDFEYIEKIAKLMEDYGLTKLELAEGEHKLMLSKEFSTSSLPTPVSVPINSTSQTTVVNASTSQEPVKAAVGDELTSPLVGVTYIAPAPGEKPFVSIGDHVKKGQTLCIIESMKVMNEFPAPRDGEITNISISDGSMVEFGETLFYLK